MNDDECRRIRGGNQELANRMASRLGARVHLSTAARLRSTTRVAGVGRLDGCWPSWRRMPSSSPYRSRCFAHLPFDPPLPDGVARGDRFRANVGGRKARGSTSLARCGRCGDVGAGTILGLHDPLRRDRRPHGRLVGRLGACRLRPSRNRGTGDVDRRDRRALARARARCRRRDRHHLARRPVGARARTRCSCRATRTSLLPSASPLAGSSSRASTPRPTGAARSKVLFEAVSALPPMCCGWCAPLERGRRGRGSSRVRLAGLRPGGRRGPRRERLAVHQPARGRMDRIPARRPLRQPARRGRTTTSRRAASLPVIRQ